MHAGRASRRDWIFSRVWHTDTLCDHGYPVACEGDLLVLISMIMLSGATQKRAALMDMVQVDPEFGGVVWWHCGIGLPSYANENGMKIKEYPCAPGAPQDPGTVGDLIFNKQKASIFRVADNGDRFFALSAEIGKQRDKGHDGVRAWFTETTNGRRARKHSGVFRNIYKKCASAPLCNVGRTRRGNADSSL